MNKNYYVYVHRKLSDNSIFYVGKGCNGRCRSTNGRNPVWWKVVIEENGFIPCIVKSTLDEAEAKEKEQVLINQIGYESLTNIKPIDFGTEVLTIPDTTTEGGAVVPYEATKKGYLSKEKELWKARPRLKDKTLPPIEEYTFLEDYFEVDNSSFEISRDIKEISKIIFDSHKKLLASMGLFSPVPASKIAQYFKLNKPKVKRVKGKTVQVVEGLKIKNV